MVPLVDLKAQYAAIQPEVDAAIQRVLCSAAFILGREVERFEDAFAAYCGVRHAVGVASGTAALHLALLACGVGPGDEVITSPHTFIATAEAVSHAGARPVFVDIDPVSYNLDPSRIDAAIGPRTKAIIPVHLYGNPADMEPVLAIARRRGLHVIEDAAQAHGAAYRGRRAGTFGAAACFSFYPGKNLGAYGDGGAVVTDNPEIAARVRMLRDHGRRDKYVHETVGYGDRLDAIHAAVLGAKLAHLDRWNQQRRQAARRYCELLADSRVRLPVTAPDAEPVYHLFVVRVAERDRTLQALHQRGIGAGVHYPIPLHLQPAYAFLGLQPGSFPHAEQAAREVLSLPLYPEITDEQLTEVAAGLKMSLQSVRAPA
ncbi:MAG: DegT/DnrJ/EryC1/StrS family aminotransferase [Candidatus Binatia bacterium]